MRHKHVRTDTFPDAVTQTMVLIRTACTTPSKRTRPPTWSPGRILVWPLLSKTACPVLHFGGSEYCRFFFVKLLWNEAQPLHCVVGCLMCIMHRLCMVDHLRVLCVALLDEMVVVYAWLRPHVIYNAKTNLFLMWYEDRGSHLSGYAVAESSTPGGPFVTKVC